MIDSSLPDEISVPIPSVAHDTLMFLRKLHGDVFIHRWLVEVGESTVKGRPVVEIGTSKGCIIWKPRGRGVVEERPVTICAPESGILVEQTTKVGWSLPLDRDIGTIRSTPQMIKDYRNQNVSLNVYHYTASTIRQEIERYQFSDVNIFAFVGAVIILVVGYALENLLGWILGGLLGEFARNIGVIIGSVIMGIAGIILIGSVLYEIYMWLAKYGKYYRIKFRTKPDHSPGVPYILDYYVDDECKEVEEIMKQKSRGFYQY